MEAKQVRDLMEAYASVYEQSMLNTVVDTATNVIKPQVEKQANKKYGPLGGMVAGREVDKIGSQVKSGDYGGALNRAVQGAGKLFNSVDVFDLIKGHLLDEGYAETEKAATVIMANMSEEWKQSIIEAVGLVGPPQKPQDVIPGVRALRTAASNIVKASDYPMNVKPQKVGTQVVPYSMIQKGSPSDTYADISTKPATASRKEPVKGEKINLRNL